MGGFQSQQSALWPVHIRHAVDCLGGKNCTSQRQLPLLRLVFLSCNSHAYTCEAIIIYIAYSIYLLLSVATGTKIITPENFSVVVCGSLKLYKSANMKHWILTGLISCILTVWVHGIFVHASWSVYVICAVAIIASYYIGFDCLFLEIVYRSCTCICQLCSLNCLGACLAVVRLTIIACSTVHAWLSDGVLRCLIASRWKMYVPILARDKCIGEIIKRADSYIYLLIRPWQNFLFQAILLYTFAQLL